jgi:DNA-binding CsgD family transcriptional regulator
MEAGQLRTDPAYELLSSIGLGWQVATLMPMPTGEICAVTFERWIDNGRPTDSEIGQLDDLRPHLARAGLIAARLGLERAQGTVAAMEKMGLPAAVLSYNRKVLAANALVEAMPSLFLTVAFGGMAIGDAEADALFQQAILAARGDAEPSVRSIPVAADEDRPPVILHVLPLRRSAHDIFSGGEILIVATMLSASAIVPSPTLLAGLFDLTPAEARLASALSRGLALKDAAAGANITVKSGRTYLERIFAKTGTRQQSQLVALLKSADRFSAP